MQGAVAATGCLDVCLHVCLRGQPVANHPPMCWPLCLQCQICLGTLRDCVSLQPCGHNACAACLSNYFASLLNSGQPLTCPLRCTAVVAPRRAQSSDAPTKSCWGACYVRCALSPARGRLSCPQVRAPGASRGE